MPLLFPQNAYTYVNMNLTHSVRNKKVRRSLYRISLLLFFYGAFQSDSSKCAFL